MLDDEGRDDRFGKGDSIVEDSNPTQRYVPGATAESFCSGAISVAAVPISDPTMWHGVDFGSRNTEVAPNLATNGGAAILRW